MVVGLGGSARTVGAWPAVCHHLASIAFPTLLSSAFHIVARLVHLSCLKVDGHLQTTKQTTKQATEISRTSLKNEPIPRAGAPDLEEDPP